MRSSDTIHAVAPTIIFDDGTSDRRRKADATENTEIENTETETTLLDEPNIGNAGRYECFPRTTV
jgi:hypothetical protein